METIKKNPKTVKTKQKNVVQGDAKISTSLVLEER